MTTMSGVTSADELLPLLAKSPVIVLGNQTHDMLVSLWQGNEELLRGLEESLSPNDPGQHVPWLNREHQELRGALI